jgi:hypothetical protein
MGCVANGIATCTERGHPIDTQSRDAEAGSDPGHRCRSHPHLGEVRHDGPPSRPNLWRRGRRDRAHSPQGLTAIGLRQLTLVHGRERRRAFHSAVGSQPCSIIWGMRGSRSFSGRRVRIVRHPSPGLTKRKRQNARPSHEAVTAAHGMSSRSTCSSRRPSLAHPPVDLDPRHALVALDCFQHATLHSAPAPTAAGGKLLNMRLTSATV